jgi:hypothetical protein
MWSPTPHLQYPSTGYKIAVRIFCVQTRRHGPFREFYYYTSVAVFFSIGQQPVVRLGPLVIQTSVSRCYTGWFIIPSGNSEFDCATTNADAAESSISVGRESLQFCLCTRRHNVLAGFAAGGQSWRNMAWTGNKKAFCVLQFAKNESILTVQQTFRTVYRTEPPTDKTIRQRYINPLPLIFKSLLPG